MTSFLGKNFLSIYRSVRVFRERLSIFMCVFSLLDLRARCEICISS